MDALPQNTAVSHYRILSRLGSGGMGDVYLAEDMKLGRKVALKILSAKFTSDEGRVRRFQLEARAASALNHPNILTIYDVGDDAGIHFIATEYIAGQTLRQRLSQGRMAPLEALGIAMQAAAALTEAHAAGIVHRDIKPENIMLRSHGLVKVVDFGLAKLAEPPVPGEESETSTAAIDTDAGTVLGTPYYMSPEQARGKTLDARTDIFSLGVVLYESIAGRRPFDGDTSSHAIVSILEKEPLPLARYVPEVPQELQRILGKALEKDREERYQVVKDLHLDLKRLKQQLELDTAVERAPSSGTVTGLSTSSSARTVSSAEYIATGIGRHKRFVIAAVAVLAAAAAVAVYLRRAPPLTEKDSIVLADFVNTTGDAVFDSTLKEALAVSLEQSPYLNIFSDEQVRETLSFMNRTQDDRLTRDLAREICQRRGVKALMSGSVANLGSHYVISLDAVEAASGDVIARQQLEADSKERILRTLGEAAAKIRAKLGESLGSIRKYDVPLEEATTSSLDALKAYSLGHIKNRNYEFRAAIPYARRAVELDPNFARGYLLLGQAYRNAGQSDFAAQFTQKAFELRERSSQLEQLIIAGNYYASVTGEMDKAIESGEALIQIYPRDPYGRNHLASYYSTVGQNEKALEQEREAVRLGPSALEYGNLASLFIRNNQFAEAKATCEQAAAQKLDSARCRTNIYQVAIVSGDTAAMKRYLPDAVGIQPGLAAFAGQLGKMRALYDPLIKQAVQNGSTETAASLAETQAVIEADLGDCRDATADALRGLAVARTRYAIRTCAVALAQCGEGGKAQALRDEYSSLSPANSLANSIYLPDIGAAIAIHANRPAEAILELEGAATYSGATLYPEYIRGQAYLLQRSGKEAAAEFQKILDHRGLNMAGPLWPLAHLGLARAAALLGDTAKSRKAYQDLFALWKGADADLPILAEAKLEYTQLR